MFKSMFKSKKGASAIEYALIASLVGGAVMVSSSAPEVGHRVHVTMCKAASYVQGGDGNATCLGAFTPPPPPPPPTPSQQCMNAGDVWDSDNNYCWGGSSGNPPWWAANPGQKAAGQHMFT